MAIIRSIDESNLNYIAPSVFIESVELMSGSYRVVYSLQDKVGDWSLSEDVLNDFSIYIKSEKNEKTIRLKDLLLQSKFVNNRIYGETVFFEPITGSITITAYCGNQNLFGEITKENILKDEIIVTSSYAKDSFAYLNKAKDLRLLDVNFSLSPSPTNIGTYKSDLYISYRADKRANVGFLFDVEKFLYQKSPYYKILSNYANFKKILLSRSTVDLKKSSFKKLDLTLKQERYSKIENSIYSSMMDSNNYTYFISATDDNSDTQNKHRYQIAASLIIKDFSYEFFSNHIKKKIQASKEELKKYISLFTSYTIDNIEKDVREQIFTDDYESGSKIKDSIKLIVDSTAHIAAFYNNIDVDKYTSLYLSILHPLTTNQRLLGLLMNHLNRLESITDKLFRDIAAADGSGNTDYEKYTPEITLEFTKAEENINYDYDHGCGYEVLSIDNLKTRLDDPKNGIKQITTFEKDIRFSYEAKKYFKNALLDQLRSSKYLSISQVDIKNNTYDLLTNPSNLNTSVINDFFIKASEYNNHTFSYRKEESLYFQLSDNGICIKSISAGVNTSRNGLNRSVVFDPNQDSSAQSLQFLTSTGVEEVFLATNNLPLPNPPKDSMQYIAGYESASTQIPYFKITESVKTNPEAKPKNIAFYGSLYEEKIEKAGSNYDLVLLANAEGLSQLFTKKFKLYNQVYLLEKSKISAPTAKEIVLPDYLKDLNSNIPAKYLNRHTEDGKLLISTDILL
jgi:hypothetical protein